MPEKKKKKFNPSSRIEDLDIDLGSLLKELRQKLRNLETLHTLESKKTLKWYKKFVHDQEFYRRTLKYILIIGMIIGILFGILIGGVLF